LELLKNKRFIVKKFLEGSSGTIGIFLTVVVYFIEEGKKTNNGDSGV